MKKKRLRRLPAVVIERFLLDEIRRDGSTVLVPYIAGDWIETRAVDINLAREAALRVISAIGPEAPPVKLALGKR